VADIPKVAAYVKPGDVIVFNNFDDVPKGVINHVAIVTKVENGEIFYSGHSTIRNNESLEEVLTRDGYRGDLYFIHIKYE
jgi:signal peptidase I